MRTTALVLALLAAACGTPGGDPPPDPPAGDAIPTGAWVLVEGVMDGVALPLVASHPVTLEVDGDSLGGTSACNRYGGDLVVDASGTFDAGDGLFMTAMGCLDEGVMEIERIFHAAITRIDSWTFDGDELVLEGASVTLRWSPIAPVPTEALIGTTWHLETVTRGETATSAAGDGFVRFAEDGSMEGATGCRGLVGAWVERAGEVVLFELAAEGDCPADLRAQDDLVVEVLGDGFTPTIDGDLLTAASGSDSLVFRAEGSTP